MIKHIAAGPGLAVAGSVPTYQYIIPNINNPLTGMLRVNNNNLEVFDGGGWQLLQVSFPTISLDQDTQDLLQWARTQQQLGLNRATLIKNNPALQKAHEAVRRAEENFDILSVFVEYDLDTESKETAP